MTSDCSHIVYARNSGPTRLQLSSFWLRLILAFFFVSYMVTEGLAADSTVTRTYEIGSKKKSMSAPDIELALESPGFPSTTGIWVCERGKGTFELRGDIGTGFYKLGRAIRSAFFKYEGYGNIEPSSGKHTGHVYKEGGVSRYWFFAENPRIGDGLYYVVYTTTLWGNYTFHCLAELM